MFHELCSPLHQDKEQPGTKSFKDISEIFSVNWEISVSKKNKDSYRLYSATIESTDPLYEAIFWRYKKMSRICSYGPIHGGQKTLRMHWVNFNFCVLRCAFFAHIIVSATYYNLKYVLLVICDLRSASYIDRTYAFVAHFYHATNSPIWIHYNLWRNISSLRHKLAHISIVALQSRSSVRILNRDLCRNISAHRTRKKKIKAFLHIIQYE